MSPNERDEVVAQYLQTPEGRLRFRRAFLQGCAEAADHFPEGSIGEGLCRIIAGMHPRKPIDVNLLRALAGKKPE